MRPSYIALKCDSYDTNAFKRNMENYSKKGLVLVFDKNGVQGVFPFTPFSIINIIILALVVFCYCIRYRPYTLISENTYTSCLVGILRKVGWVKRFVHIPGDWLENKYYPYFDRISCYWADLVLDHTEELSGKRTTYWGKEICKKKSVYPLMLENKFVESYGRNVLFIGKIRDDSGLELVNEDFFSLKTLAYVPRENFKREFSDCFCGVNLLTKPSYSSCTIPSKIMEYLQHGLPVVITQNCGPMSRTIEELRLGIVVIPHRVSVTSALINVRSSVYQYRNNIKDFVEKNSSDQQMRKILEDA